ncbi:hypothetical protein B0T25DRAFT_228858 [Lasiosphaeria hispida]|uniref:Uncharacterized protein n=1 Tax=Lasiosphaeria hispida TaxID=260671 RepID=A0AAJ0HDD7_9PEZI|nr:hypothetical protein B0T25DRAFT_228858 [Lasiosphaeria hispida]
MGMLATITALVGAMRTLHARRDKPISSKSLPDRAYITWSTLYDMMPFRDMRRDKQEGPEACKQVVEWRNADTVLDGLMSAESRPPRMGGLCRETVSDPPRLITLLSVSLLLQHCQRHK